MGLIFSLMAAKNLNILLLGEEKARHLGMNVEKFKLLLFDLNSMMVAAAVAISGTIGFVGLVVPHITRLIVGPNHKIFIPSSAIAGAILVLLADDLARVIDSMCDDDGPARHASSLKPPGFQGNAVV